MTTKKKAEELLKKWELDSLQVMFIQHKSEFDRFLNVEIVKLHRYAKNLVIAGLLDNEDAFFRDFYIIDEEHKGFRPADLVWMFGRTGTQSASSLIYQMSTNCPQKSA